MKIYMQGGTVMWPKSHMILWKLSWTRFHGSEVCEVVQCKYLAIFFDSRLPDCSEMCVCVYNKTPKQKKSASNYEPDCNQRLWEIYFKTDAYKIILYYEAKCSGTNVLYLHLVVVWWDCNCHEESNQSLMFWGKETSEDDCYCFFIFSYFYILFMTFYMHIFSGSAWL